MLICGLFINGICVGITSSQVPVYLAEISRKEIRGSIIVIQQWAIEWGIFIMYFAAYGCSFIKGPASFRTAWALQLVPAVFLMLGIPFLPESPRWLAKVGREKEAIAVLADIQANGNTSDPLVIAEWEEITTILAAEREGQKGWRRFVKNGMCKLSLGVLHLSRNVTISIPLNALWAFTNTFCRETYVCWHISPSVAAT